MARNTYFSQGSTKERNVYEDMIIEAIKIYGQDVYYLPRTIVSEDDILNEDIESKFTGAYLIEMYLENVDAFEGDGTLLSKFGLEIRDAATLIVAKRSWEKSTYGSGLLRPNEGDLIYFALTKTLMQITFVEHEQPFYQLQNLPVYKLNIESFEYRDEALDTGLDIIDEIELKRGTRTNLTMNSGGTGTYQIGEIISSADGTAGEVAEWDSTTRLLAVVGLSGNFSVGDTITGGTSSASFTISAINGLTAIDDNDAFADNDIFETTGNNFVDFSEINPFGEIN
jgi:hypothetical protein